MLTSIYKRKSRDGVTLEYEDPATGRLRQKQFRAKDGRTAKDRAQAYAAELRSIAASPPATAASDITFPEYAARWLRATKTAVRAGTYRLYGSAVRVHLSLAFPGRIRDVTRAQVLDLVVRLRESGLRKTSVGNIRGTLRSILETAVEEGVLAANVASFKSRSKLMRLGSTQGERRGLVKALTIDQARTFFAAAAAVAPHHHMLWRTMVATGLRPGEAQGLRPEDLDYSGGLITVGRAVTAGRVEPCKTTAQGEFERVDMPQALADELRAWEAATAAEAMSCGRPRSEWLFPSTTGGLLAETGCRDAFKRAIRKARLIGFTQHSLRHTYATQQLKAGESIYYVQRQLRHADIRMTVGTYGSWLPAGDRTVADRHYARLFGGGMSESSQSQHPAGPVQHDRKTVKQA